jgi:hypothetical protein
MTEIVHAPTGELIDYQPVSSLEIEFIIREIGDRLESAVLVLDQLQRGRYDAEEEYSRAFETAKLTAKYPTYNDRIAAARLECLPLLRLVNEAKAKLHHAEHLQDALKSKLMGYQNINKVNGAAYSVGGVGR